MTLDVCLEASGSYAHLIGVDMVNAMLPIRRARWRRRQRSAAAIEGFERRLTAALDRLPILLAHVLWLVDVCGCTYDTAAAELGTSPERVEQLVAEARSQLRADLAASVGEGSAGGGLSGPRRSPGGSTNRSRPGWLRPGR